MECKTTANARRMVDLSGFMLYTGLGRNKALAFGKEIGCTVKIGRRVVYDLKKADAYFDSITGQSGAGTDHE